MAIHAVSRCRIAPSIRCGISQFIPCAESVHESDKELFDRHSRIRVDFRHPIRLNWGRPKWGISGAIKHRL